MMHSYKPVMASDATARRVRAQDLDDVVLATCQQLGRMAHASEIIRLVHLERPDANAHRIRWDVLPRLLRQGHLRSHDKGYYAPEARA